jgi:hypothetical protein
VDYLTADNHERWRPIVMPTASGKTVAAQVAATLLIREGRMKNVLILAPQEHIEDTFLDPGRWTFNSYDGSSQIVDVSRDILVRLRDHVPSKFFSEVPERKIIVTTHAQITLLLKKGALPNELSKWAVCIDEGHHSGKDATLLDDFSSLASARGAEIWPLTASPFRSDNRRIFPADAKPLVFSYSALASQGSLPQNIIFETIELDRPDRVHGEHLPEDIKAICEFVAASKRPTVIRIQRGQGSSDDENMRSSKAIAKKYIEALVAAGVPRPETMQAVGDEDEINNEIKRRLAEDRHLARTKGYRHLTLRVVVSCQRFGEGADWPFCSQVVSVGLPTTLGGVVQLIGRGARSKKSIKDYPKPWVDEVKFVAFVPLLDAKLGRDLSRARMLLLAATLECNEVICDLMRFWQDFVVGFRLPPEIRPRAGFWELVTAVDPEQEANAKLVGIEACVNLRQIFGRDPTLREVVRKLRRWGSGTKEVRALIEGVMSEYPEVKEAAKQALVQATTEGVAKAAVQGTGVASVDVAEVKSAFDEALLAALLGVAERYGDLSVSMDTRLLQKFHGATAGVMSSFTAQSLPVWVSSLVRARDIVYDVSDVEVVERILLPYLRAFGRRPSSKLNGTTDVSLLAEAEMNLIQLDMALRRRGRLDVYRMSACEPEWITGPDIDWSTVAKIPLRRRSGIKESDWATAADIDKKKNDRRCVFYIDGRPEHLLGLELALRFGWRGAGQTGKKSLAEL